MVICRVKRHEAVTCLKEINAITSMSPDSVELCPSKANDDSTGYQVHIKTTRDNHTKQQLVSIAQKQGLALKEENGKVVIYEHK